MVRIHKTSPSVFYVKTAFQLSMKGNYGYLLIAVASAIWGTMGIFGKLAFAYGISPATLIALRVLISSSTILIPITLFKRELLRIQRKDAIKFLLLGVFGTALVRIAYFYAVDLTTVTMATVLFYTHPVFIAVYASIFLREKVTKWTILAITLTFLGVTFAVKAYESSWLSTNILGIVSGLLSSIMFVTYFLITKNLRNHYTNWTLILYGDGIGALATLPIALFAVPEMLSYPQELWFIIFTIAWIPSLAAYLIYSYALKHVESAKGSVMAVMEPLSAAILSTTLLGEKFEPLQVLGITLALTGVVLLFYKPTLKK